MNRMSSFNTTMSMFSKMSGFTLSELILNSPYLPRNLQSFRILATSASRSLRFIVLFIIRSRDFFSFSGKAERSVASGLNTLYLND